MRARALPIQDLELTPAVQTLTLAHLVEMAKPMATRNAMMATRKVEMAAAKYVRSNAAKLCSHKSNPKRSSKTRSRFAV
jgi:hypothetical protein